ncbi:MAG: hypothetical protein R8M45_05760 [Ghiorsea sp.]
MQSTIIKYGHLLRPDSFPPVMSDIAAAAGCVATLMYAKEFGGVEIYVQRWGIGCRPTRETINMLKHITPDAVAVITAAYGGEKVLIRKCEGILSELRKIEIVNMNNAGVSRMDIARTTGRSIRHVREICNHG